MPLEKQEIENILKEFKTECQDLGATVDDLAISTYCSDILRSRGEECLKKYFRHLSSQDLKAVINHVREQAKPKTEAGGGLRRPTGPTRKAGAAEVRPSSELDSKDK